MCKTNRKSFYIIAFIIIAIIAGIVYINKNTLLKRYNELFPAKKIESLNLSHEQKIADFEKMYDTIVSGFSNLDCIKEYNSIDFVQRKSYYLNLINKTENDFQYYCTMKAILCDLSSFHTSLCFPDYKSLCGTKGYDLKQVLAERDTIPYIEYWNKEIEKRCREYSKIAVAEFRYIDGKYIYDEWYSNDEYDDLQGYSIETIDGINIDKYAVDNVSIYYTRYDSGHNKPYKRTVAFNDEIGEMHEVVFKSDNGGSVTKELYTSLEMEIVSEFSYVYDEEIDSSYCDIYDYYDADLDVLYVAVNNFVNNNGNSLKDIFLQASDDTKIIIDLRDNYGGSSLYAEKYIYPYLYDKDIVFEEKWFVPSSEVNDAFSKNLLNKTMYKIKKCDKGYEYSRKIMYKGGKADRSNNVYYLIGKSTGSAADEYISMIKNNNLGTIIGTNTAGEGLGGSFFVCRLKNSGLVYIFYPSKALNPEGMNNAVTGTNPDIYIAQSEQSFYSQRKICEEGGDCEMYENRLEWDNVLLETLDIIRK